MWQIASNSPNYAKVGSMATKEDRGTKRTCQNGDCSARFYDLNRDPIACPICGADYVIAHSPVPITSVPPEEKTPRKPKKEFASTEDTVDEADAEEEALAEVETDDSVDDDDSDDETFLEDEEEDGGDVAKIIGPVEGEEET